jgi:hypothetical protein
MSRTKLWQGKLGQFQDGWNTQLILSKPKIFFEEKSKHFLFFDIKLAQNLLKSQRSFFVFPANAAKIQIILTVIF